MFLLFNMLSRLVMAFPPRTKYILISWLQSPSAVIWEGKKIKSLTVSTVSPSICHEVMGPDAMILAFCMLSFKPTFFTPLFDLHQEALQLFIFCHKGGVICVSEVQSLSCIQLFVTPSTVAYHGPPSMGFSRQEYWSGLPLPSPEDLSNPGLEPGSPTLQADTLPSEPSGKSSSI